MWKLDIWLAQAAYINGFALNIRADDKTLGIYLSKTFEAADSLGFKMIFFYDYAGGGPLEFKHCYFYDNAIMSWNDFGESHHIGPLYVEGNSYEAFTVGKTPFNYALDMPYNGWHELLPFTIDLYKNGPVLLATKAFQVVYPFVSSQLVVIGRLLIVNGPNCDDNRARVRAKICAAVVDAGSAAGSLGPHSAEVYFPNRDSDCLVASKQGRVKDLVLVDVLRAVIAGAVLGNNAVLRIDTDNIKIFS
ncbi:hypothetical protein VTI74DRAFT_7989 [Chaetomium olivicolor]